MTPAHLIQFWEEAEEEGKTFRLEALVKIKTGIIVAGSIQSIFPIRHLSWDVDNPEATLAVKVCGTFVPWNAESKTFQTERYSISLDDMVFADAEEPEAEGEEPEPTIINGVV